MGETCRAIDLEPRILTMTTPGLIAIIHEPICSFINALSPRRHGLWPRNYLQVVVNGVWSLDVERGAHSERGFGGYLKSTKRHFYDTRMEVPLKFSFPE